MEWDVRTYFAAKAGSKASMDVKFDGLAGSIEALVSRPANITRRAVAIVCHPHPLYDGSMNNKVTYMLARTFNDLGVPAIRFNFRGVGESEGRYDEGRGETDDLITVVENARLMYPGAEIWLAGFSFGAYIALKAAADLEVQRLITVAPPVNFFDFSGLGSPNCPWLLVQGTNDEIVPFAAVDEWVSELNQQPASVYMDDVGHFFHKKLNDLRAVIEEHIIGQTADACAVNQN